jgi:hypothetical protein
VANDFRAILINNSIHGGSGNISYGVGIVGKAIMVNNTIHVGSGLQNAGLFIREGRADLINNDIWGATMNCMVFNIDYYPNGTCEAYTLIGLNLCFWTGCDQSSGNISTDPLSDVDGVHLTAASSCIDTGIDPTPWYAGGLADFDIDGDARPYGAGWDIGADEWM